MITLNGSVMASSVGLLIDQNHLRLLNIFMKLHRDFIPSVSNCNDTNKISVCAVVSVLLVNGFECLCTQISRSGVGSAFF